VLVEGERRPRVLVANLEPMLLLGMTTMLADGGVEVLNDNGQPASVVEEACRLHPDAVVLGTAGPGRDISRLVRDALPASKVILWSRDETEMEVFDPGSTLPRIRSGASDELLSELVGPRPDR
jgi:DNA-binding NarL/FixJ family response regulator